MALELNCEFANYYCAMAYPGSRLYEQAVREQWLLPAGHAARKFGAETARHVREMASHRLERKILTSSFLNSGTDSEGWPERMTGGINMKYPESRTTLILSTSTFTTEPLIGSWLSLGVGKTGIIYYDRTKVLPQDIKRIKPRIIIFIAGLVLFRPSRDELLRMNELSPVVQILCDGGDPDWHPELLRWRDAFTLIVNIDGSPNWPSRDKDLTLLAPIDARFYSNMPGESDPQRDIHAGFGGAIGSGARGQVMGYLYERGFITHRGYSTISSYKGYAGHAASYKEYADFMRRCKIVVNHAMSANGSSQVKARVLEAGWAGACLLQNKNPITPLWFKPGVHYIEYDNAKHAAQLIQQLKSEPKRIKQVANALHEEVVRNHSPKVFWRKVLDRVGWFPPHPFSGSEASPGHRG